MIRRLQTAHSGAAVANGAPRENSRLPGFDILRILGAVGVVWIHACDTNARALRWSGLAAFAVPCFLLMSAFFLQDRALRQPAVGARELASRRLRRLLPAYLC